MVWLSLLPQDTEQHVNWATWLTKQLQYTIIVIVCSPGCDVMNFEFNFIFLIKLLIFYMTKK